MKKAPHKRSYIKLFGISLAIGLIGFSYIHVRHTSNNVQASKASLKTSTSAANTPVAQAAQPVAHTDAQLQQIVDTWAGQQPFSSSVAISELTGDLRTAGRNQSTQMVTASTYKLYVAYATLDQVELGTYTMETATRTGQTVSSALQKMILQSDNTSAEALGFLIGWNRIDQLAAAVGATHTDINNYDSSGNPTNGDKHSTAADLTTIVSKLQQGTLLSPANTRLLLGLMKNQVWRERVPAGVPSGVVVADKPGWLGNVQNDAAIVYGPRSTYTIVVMTDGNHTQPLANLSQLIYNYLEK